MVYSKIFSTVSSFPATPLTSRVETRLYNWFISLSSVAVLDEPEVKDDRMDDDDDGAGGLDSGRTIEP